MSDSSEISAGTLEQIIADALTAVQMAATDGALLSLARVSRKLNARYPDSGMTEREFREFVARLARTRGVPVTFD